MPDDAAQARIDECLSVRDGHLWIEDCDAMELAARFGTPIYVVSENQLRRNARRILRAFSGQWPGAVRVLPSIKANHVLALRRILTSEGLGCDTFGASELWAALACGVRPDLISVNGTGKSVQLVEQAVGAGCRLTLDSPRELDLAIEAARKHGRPAQIRVRVRPDLSALVQVASDFSADGDSITEVSRHYKAGIPMNELLPMGERALQSDDVELVGVHAHFARHTASLDAWAAMMDAFGDTVGTLSVAWGGWQPREIDVGGGFPTRRDPTGRAIPRLAAQTGPAPPVERYAEVIASSLSQSLATHGMDASGMTLEIEPGRACYADIGVHLSRVINIKRETAPSPLSFVELDTTEMFLIDVHLEHNRWSHIVANRAADPATMAADIVGMSCGFDTIVPDAAVPEPAPGDVVAFLDTGAYQEACASNFNAMPRPATVLVRDDTASVVRRAETIEDVFRRDVDWPSSGHP
ncbi:MAG: diaminopimelate decarboxylase family protein [Streptosporangiaceae bacterium]